MNTTELKVSGLTCGHCVNAVIDELRAIDGVSDISVELVASGVSTVTVTAERMPDAEKIRAALDEAGNYQLV
jgi:copper chaperone